uniref:Uncharacterized protein n=1 Tax=Salix viminalis TaxID=40686 RepID=A0A6N2K805_SALVM
MTEPLIQKGRRRVNFRILLKDAPVFLKLFAAYSKFIWSASVGNVSKHIDAATAIPHCSVMLRCNNSLVSGYCSMFEHSGCLVPFRQTSSSDSLQRITNYAGLISETSSEIGKDMSKRVGLLCLGYQVLH